MCAMQAAKAWAGVGSAGSDSLDAPDAPLPQLPTWQAAALATLGLQGPNANLEVNILQAAPSNGSTCPVDPRLLAGTRVLCAANASELNGASGLEALGRWDAPLSVRNEAATLRTLSGVCLLALAQLPGSEEDDVALLQKGIGGAPISSDVQLAIRFRLEKKRLLTCAARALAARLQEVQSGTGFSVEGARKGEKRVKEAKPAGKGFGR